MTTDPLKTSPEQLLYSKILRIGMLIGLLTLFLTFTIYTIGILQPTIPLEDIPELLTRPVETRDGIEGANFYKGWEWTEKLRYSDFLNFIGVIIMAGVTIICYISIIPTLIKKKDFIYLAIVILEVVVLSLAASGLLESGH